MYLAGFDPALCLQDLQQADSQGAASPSSSSADPERAEPERKVSRVELALTWASDLRLRLRLLLSVAGESPSAGSFIRHVQSQVLAKRVAAQA